MISPGDHGPRSKPAPPQGAAGFTAELEAAIGITQLTGPLAPMSNQEIWQEIQAAWQQVETLPDPPPDFDPPEPPDMLNIMQELMSIRFLIEKDKSKSTGNTVGIELQLAKLQVSLTKFAEELEAAGLSQWAGKLRKTALEA